MIAATSTSGYSVYLPGGFSNLVAVEPGAIFLGLVSGGNTIGATAISTLELAPGELAPGELASGELASGAAAGTLTAFGTQFVNFAQIGVDPGASWALGGGDTLAQGTTLSDAGSLDLSGATAGGGVVTIDNTAGVPAAMAISDRGSWSGLSSLVAGGSGSGDVVIDTAGSMGSANVVVAQGVGSSGEITVDGTQSLLNDTGSFVAGDGGLGGLTVEAGGTAIAGDGAVIANASGASGSAINVSGEGSAFRVAGSLVVGNAGFGSLALSQSATVTAGRLDAGAGAGGDGVVSVAGVGTSLNLSGDLTVGGQSTGELSILSGAVVSAVNGNVGGTSGSGNVDIEGSGSALDLSGTLSIGLNAPAVFTLGENTELTLSGSVVTGADGVFNQDGTVDPANVVNDNVTNLGNGAKTEADVSIENSGVYTLSNGTASMYTPLITYDANPDTDGGSASGVWQIGNLGTLVLNATTVDASQTIEFTRNNAVLEIGQVPATNIGTITPGSPNVLPGFEAPIQNYKTGDKILFNGLSYGSDTMSGNAVTLWSGAGGTGSDLGSLSFITPSGAADNTGAGLAAAQIETGAVACFAAGTRIGTQGGFTRVEELRVRDTVLTADGRCEAVVWVGSRTVDCVRHPRPETVWPVRIAKGAFGANTPARNLHLSPDHAVFVNGVLVPVKLLINGTTIAQVKRRTVTYHHIELSTHEVILAEGLPVESYLDVGDRANLAGDRAADLYPSFDVSPDAAMVWETRGAAPLVVAGKALAGARGWERP
jgi:T5SS/PEP-CTERM-associated repeat protein